jgi:hypothetical protein
MLRRNSQEPIRGANLLVQGMWSPRAIRGVSNDADENSAKKLLLKGECDEDKARFQAIKDG